MNSDGIDELAKKAMEEVTEVAGRSTGGLPRLTFDLTKLSPLDKEGNRKQIRVKPATKPLSRRSQESL
jgi:hypothetical protein